MNDPRNGLPLEPQVVAKTLKYTPAQEYLVRRLGSAMILQWDALPDSLQDLIIDQAAAVEDREDGARTTGDIENFIRKAKVVALSKPTPPPS